MPLPATTKYNQDLAEMIKDNQKIAREIAKKNTEKSQKSSKKNYDQGATEVKFKVGDYVMIKVETRKPGKSKKFQQSFDGPYMVSERINETTFKVIGRGKRKGASQTFHVNKFKKFSPREDELSGPRPIELEENDEQTADNESASETSEEETPEENTGLASFEPESPVMIENPTAVETIILPKRKKKVSFEPESPVMIENPTPVETIILPKRKKKGKRGRKSKTNEVMDKPNYEGKQKDTGCEEILDHRRRRNKLEFSVNKGGKVVWLERKEISNGKAIEYLDKIEKPNTRSRGIQEMRVERKRNNKLGGPATRSTVQNYMDETVIHGRSLVRADIATGPNFRGLALAIFLLFLLFLILLFIGMMGGI